MKINFQKIKNLFTKEGFKRYLHHLYSLEEKPSKIALSVALGILIGTIVPIGLQTIIAIPLCLLLECNIILTTTATLISNPFTIVPMYLLAMKIGEYFTTIKISWNEINGMLQHPTVNSFLELGREGLIVILIGLLIMAAIFSTISYFLTLRLVTVYKTKNPHIKSTYNRNTSIK